MLSLIARIMARHTRAAGFRLPYVQKGSVRILSISSMTRSTSGSWPTNTVKQEILARKIAAAD